jgi:tyrosinase
MPYWDWTYEAADAYNSKFFDPSPHGVGGWGKVEDDYQVLDGGFKDWIRVYPSPHHIRRNFSIFPFTNTALLPPWGNTPDSPPRPVGLMVNNTMTKENVDFIVNNFEGDYMEFQHYFESPNGTHIGAHLLLGGDMTGFCPADAPASCVPGPKWTPNDPVFFLHHAFVDKIWYDWQNKSPKNKYSFGGGLVQATTNFTAFAGNPNGLRPFMGFDTELPSDGLWNATVWDIMDTKAGELCYDYE